MAYFGEKSLFGRTAAAAATTTAAAAAVVTMAAATRTAAAAAATWGYGSCSHQQLPNNYPDNYRRNPYFGLKLLLINASGSWVVVAF